MRMDQFFLKGFGHREDMWRETHQNNLGSEGERERGERERGERERGEREGGIGLKGD